MLPLQILIAIAVFVILIWLDTISYIASSVALFFLFYFAMAVFDISLKQAVFYSVGIIFFMVTKNALKKKLPTNQTSTDFNGSEPGGKYSGLKYHIATILIGIGMIVIMLIMSASAKGQILGVATLSIGATGFSAWISAQFAPALSLALGFIENRDFIALLNTLALLKDPIVSGFTMLVSAVPVIGALTVPLVGFAAMAMPFIITCLMFGTFHIIAYNVSLGLMLWAAMIMAMWIISYKRTGGDTTAMDTAHGGWNGILTAKETLSIAPL